MTQHIPGSTFYFTTFMQRVRGPDIPINSPSRTCTRCGAVNSGPSHQAGDPPTFDHNWWKNGHIDNTCPPQPERHTT